MRKPTPFLMIWPTIGMLMLAMASEAAPDSEEESSEAVVVTATRTPTPESQVASSITVITAADIEARQQQTLPDVLRDVPGLNLVRTGGPGGQTSVFMRGTNNNHTKVLVDGIDVSDPSSANATFDFGQFLTQDIERVEILRGPQSGLYGSDAIGGVINIITRSGSGPPQFATTAEGGSFDTFNQSGSVRGSQDRFHYTANVEHFHTGATPVTPLDLLAPAEARNDDYYDNRTASTKLGYDVTHDFDLSVVGRYTDTHLRFTGQDFTTFPSIPAAQQSASNMTQYYGRLAAHLASFSGLLEQTLGVAYTRDRTSNFDPVGPVTLDTGERTKVDWQGTLKFARAQTLVLGAEHAHDEISAPISAGMTIDSGYAELQSQLLSGLYAALNVRYDHNDRFGDKATYRVAPVYLLGDTGLKLKASVGSGFKAPTLSELFQDYPPFFFSNPHLKAENSVGYDAGVEEAARGDTYKAGVTYFHNRIRDLITTDSTGTTYANVGRAVTDGVESFVAYRPNQSVTLRADYTFTEATDTVLNEELLRRPKHKASLSADWHVTRSLAMNAALLTVGPWIDGNRDFSIPRLRAPGYTTVNFATSYQVTPHFSVFTHLDNLFDRHYQNPVGFMQPGLGLFAGIRSGF